ncbi:type II toxin-antitoxin system RelE/ParE family toxin [Halobacterium sp. KA-4]|uniref:type II toxin-antitoxin system RelE family toxin n=1 Tax=Halobacterium sp. KA-4 TaxID=2896367 RepID=UPI001E55CBDB|nr:type II toxin-antitoxin system RelE/ParE family toxin [Halobacterium sp. KA-4]MCD2201030.1 type II toxin-antitoxin system RelE/ParE family toxin [Halobacterium sp. KA-4]
MSDEEWTWELSSTAQTDLDSLSPTEQDRILDKLDEIITSPWRDPPDYGEPLQNSPHKKIRVGGFRLSATFRQDEQRLVIARIKRRGGAYTADND